MKEKKVIHRLTISNAGTELKKLVRKVNKDKELFILEDGGVPLAAIMDLDDLEDYLELQNPKLNKQIKKSFEEYKLGKGRQVDEFLAELKGKNNRNK